MSDQLQAVVTHLGGMKFSGGAGSGHSVTIDASVEHGGEDAGFRPLELLLVGLGGCTGMDVVSILQKMKQDVTGYEVRVTGDRADDHPKVCTTIWVEHIVKGRQLKPNMVEKAISLSTERYCPAIGMLRKAASIITSFRIEEEVGEEVGS
jgi:putative redox protein